MDIIRGVNGLVLPRLLEAPLAAALKSYPVVVVTGARQAGKSTLVQQVEEGGRTYLTLDDLEVLERARQEPASLVHGSRRLTLDEVQRSPDLLLAVKQAVDERRAAGRYL